MKEAIVVDLDGKYIEPVVVDDLTSGVIPHYEMPKQEHEEDINTLIELYPVLTSYTVAVPVPQGLYEPTFNIEGYTEEKENYDELLKQYFGELGQYDPDTRMKPPVPPTEPDWSSFWGNGLTEEEIEALKPISVPTEMELLTERVISLEEEGTETQLALVETYEEVLGSQKENTDTQLALVDVYEQLLVLQERVAELTEKLEAS